MGSGTETSSTVNSSGDKGGPTITPTATSDTDNRNDLPDGSTSDFSLNNQV